MTESTSPGEIEAEIELKRAELARTLDELGTRLDVKTRAKERIGPPQLALAGAAIALIIGLTVWRRRR